MQRRSTGHDVRFRLQRHVNCTSPRAASGFVTASDGFRLSRGQPCSSIHLVTKGTHVFSACNSLCPFLLAALPALGRGAASRAVRCGPRSHRFSGQHPAHQQTQYPGYHTPLTSVVHYCTRHHQLIPRCTSRVQVPQGTCEKVGRDWMGTGRRSLERQVLRLQLHVFRGSAACDEKTDEV